jgi:hypothetical protein
VLLAMPQNNEGKSLICERNGYNPTVGSRPSDVGFFAGQPRKSGFHRLPGSDGIDVGSLLADDLGAEGCRHRHGHEPEREGQGA